MGLTHDSTTAHHSGTLDIPSEASRAGATAKSLRPGRHREAIP
jgi:hypothetical protein